MTDRDDAFRREETAVHVPVLLERVLALLAPALSERPAVAVDATLGLGGHAEALLAAHPQLTLVGLDRDQAALARSRDRLAPYAARIHLVHAVYDRMPDVLDDLGFTGVDGVLFDLGVSSMQLDVAERGFAYAQDAPLDMRMDQSTGMTAEDVVNTYAVPDLARVLREYGEERFALRIAQAIDRERRVAPLRSTAHLAELVREAIPAATRRRGGHPAKRTFQALRIEVNAELDAVRDAVPAALDALGVGGAHRRARLPVTRGPDREEVVRGAGDGSHAPGHAGDAARERPAAAVAEPRVGAGDRGRDRGQPAGRVGAAASGRANPRVGMTARATTGRPRGGKRTMRAGSASSAPRVPFALLVTGLLVGGVALLLALNTASAANELQHHALDARDANVAADVEQLQNQVAASAAPANLAQAAAALGMVPAGNPAFIVEATNGTVKLLGKPQAATAAPIVQAPATAPHQPAATKAPTKTAAKKAPKKPTSKKTTSKKPTSKSKTPQKPGRTPTSSRTPKPKTSQKSTGQRHKPTRTPSPTPTPTPTMTLPGGTR